MATIDYGPRDRQGPKAPHDHTPPRAPGSVRRTTTLDGSHPDGPGGPQLLLLRARDLLTDAEGRGVELGRVEVRLRIEPRAGILEIESDPVDTRLGALVGRNPFIGWRRGIDELLADDRGSGSLLYLLLDSLSGWMGLASFGLAMAPRPEGAVPVAAPAAPRPAMDLSVRVDLCAGWQEGGTILGLLSTDQSAAEFLRPTAPVLAVADDPLAWHEVDALPPFAARRCRRLDVIDGRPLRVDGMFRDTAVDADGVEGVLHEYDVNATVDPDTLQFVGSEAVPRALPFVECPQAAVSAQQLVGRDVAAMRPFVSREMRGISTCTHLNELYRTFADIGALASLLPAR